MTATQPTTHERNNSRTGSENTDPQAGEAYECDILSPEEALYFHDHDSGARTQVHVQQWPHENIWKAWAVKIKGSEEIATIWINESANTRETALASAFSWMEDRPEGVQKGSNHVA